MHVARLSWVLTNVKDFLALDCCDRQGWERSSACRNDAGLVHVLELVSGRSHGDGSTWADASVVRHLQ